MVPRAVQELSRGLGPFPVASIGAEDGPRADRCSPEGAANDDQNGFQQGQLLRFTDNVANRQLFLTSGDGCTAHDQLRTRDPSVDGGATT